MAVLPVFNILMWEIFWENGEWLHFHVQGKNGGMSILGGICFDGEGLHTYI